MTTATALDTLTQKLSAKQLRSITKSKDHTIALWVGAVSAGKTFASLIAFLLAVLQVPEGERIMIVGRTLKTIEGNVLSQLMDPKRFGPIAAQVIHTTGASTAIILGRVVELVGAPNALAEGNVRGSTLGLVYVDEVTILPRAVFDMLTTRLRVKGARMLATTNPGSKNHWLRREYILRPADHDLVVFHLTMRDNPSLERSYVVRMIRANVGMFFQRFILGLWTNAAGAVFDMFDEARHVVAWDEMPPVSAIISVGIDYGASHATSAVMLGLTDEYDDAGRWTPRLIAVDEWRHLTDHEAGIASMPPSEMARQIARWIRHPLGHTPSEELMRPRAVYADPSAKGFREELRVHMVTTQPADNDVSDGISDVASLLGQGLLVISDRCTGVLEEITEYAWDAKKQDKGEDAPVKEKDDSVDALRYAIRSSKHLWLPALKQAYDLAA